MSQGWTQTLITSQGDGSALTASTTPTSILPGQAKVTLPPGYFTAAGQKIRIRASGRASTVTTPGTLTLDVRFGAVIVATSQAFAIQTGPTTNQTWDLEWDLICRAVGNSTTATMMHVGKFLSRITLNAPAVGTTTGIGTVLIPETAPAVGTGFDSTASQVVDLFATWGTNNANTITCHMFELISCN